MNRSFFPLLLLLVMNIACTRGGHKMPFGADLLPNRVYTIDLSRDTTLLTLRGAILRIPRGTLEAEGAGSVQLEIKEAYSITEMVRAGLVTKSKGQPLSSGGMIYINAVGGQAVRIKRPIAVSLPTARLREGMQLFAGKMNEKGVIDWDYPVALAENPIEKKLMDGKEIFMGNCASCHGIREKVTGPALGYLPERRDRYWLYSFTRDNQKMLRSGDHYSRCLYEQYNKTAMPVYPNLSDVDLDKLYGYIDNESKAIDSNSIRDFKRSFDSCARYNRMKDSLAGKRIALIVDNGPQVAVKRVEPAGGTLAAGGSNAPSSSGGGLPPDDLMVRRQVRPAVYYQFSIETFGWYNIDLLTKGLPGFEESELRVRIRGEYREAVTVFLVIPSEKILCDGGLLDDATDEYGFFTKDGKIVLPQGVPAYIIAMGEYKERVVFGKTAFITNRRQSPPMELRLMTKEEMNTEVAALSIDRLSVRAADSKNSSAIRAIDKNLAAIERFKPRDCNCNCDLPESFDIKRDSAR